MRVSKDGDWKDIDTTLGVDGARVSPVATEGDVSFSNGGTDALAQVNTGAGADLKTVGLGWAGALPKPTLTGDTATYANVVSGGDLLLRATPTGFEVSLKLRTRPTKALKLNLPTSFHGLTLTQDADTHALSWKDTDGKQVAYSPAPQMWDAQIDPATDDPANTRDVGSRLTTVNGKQVLQLTPDAAWLADPATTYPVVIDPTVGLGATGDTWVANNVSTSQAGSVDLHAGSVDGGTTMYRSFLNFNVAPIAGKHVLSAQLKLWNKFSPTCTAKPVYVNASNAASNTSTTWANKPGFFTNDAVVTNFSYGASGCSARQVPIDVTALASDWADGSLPNYGFRVATPDGDAAAYKKFLSNNNAANVPVFSVTYNTPPAKPSTPTISPCSAVCSGTVLTNSPHATITSKTTDADGGTLRYDYEVWNAAHTGGRISWGSVANKPSGSYASQPQNSDRANNTTYSAHVRVFDGTDYSPWSDWAAFKTDYTAPAAPTPASTDFTENGWTTHTAGTINWSSSDANGLSGYQYAMDPNIINGVSLINSDTSKAFTGLARTQHTFTVDAVDKAGNITSSDFTFGVGYGYLASPHDQDRTQARMTLQAATDTAPGRNYVTYQSRLGTTAAFADIPVSDLTAPGGGASPSAMPLGRNGNGDFDAYTWNVANTAGADGPVQVQACFGTSASDPSPQCSGSESITLATTEFGDSAATTQAGPGTVAQLTGNYSVDATDVTVPTYQGTLTIGRTHTTLAPPTANTGATGIFGPGWTAALPGPDAGAGALVLSDHSADGYVLLTDTDGTESVYAASDSDPATFDGQDDDADGSVLHKNSGSQYVLTETDGTTTTWDKNSSGLWGVTSITESGNHATTTYTRDTAGRVTRILGAVPDGVTCTTPDTTPGCRSLTVSYATSTTATGTTLGDYTGRVKSVSFVAWDPATSAMSATQVAAYTYDATGHLRQAWDPRISPALKTGYTYNGSGRLATLTPPGQNAWQLDYDTRGRIATVKRHDDANSADATTTMVYDIPLSGTAAPRDMRAATVKAWGQTDIPETAAAVFSPDHVPAATPTATDWHYADLSYLDVNGRPVNTVGWDNGDWATTATDYDTHGNTTRALTAGNLATAADWTNPDNATINIAGSEAEAADLLATTTSYDAAGNPIDEKGSLHTVALDSATSTGPATVDARSHTVTTYDEGRPAGVDTTDLATSTVTTALATDGAEYDPKKTTVGYTPIDGKPATDPTSGWVLGQPTSTTTVMSTAADNITTRARYDAAGRVVETRTPGDSGGTAASSTNTTYYSATGTGGCVSAALAGLACQVAPAAAASSEPVLPSTTTTYNKWDLPLAVTEAAGGSTLRTITTSYDTAGRPLTNAVAATTSPVSAPVPTRTTTYNATNGMAATVADSGGTITHAYDAQGRQTSYTDADGATTTTSYDIDGRATGTTNSTGTTATTYDSITGRVTDLSDSAAGSVSGHYDVDGQLLDQTLPGGAKSIYTYDDAGNPTSITYGKGSETWGVFTNLSDRDGDVRAQTSPGSVQVFAYDNAGRLTGTDDTTPDPVAGTTPCTRRGYGFKTAGGALTNSDRTSLTTTQGVAAAVSGCDLTGATPTTTTSTYDTADRLTATGTAYDALGRTTTAAAGSVTGGTAMSLTYFGDDMTRSQTQNGRTITYGLDAGNRLHTQTDSSTGITQIQHYDDDSDNPAWTTLSGSTTGWTRTLTGLDGNLAATANQAGAVTDQFTNLHGDVVATAPTAAADTDGFANYTDTDEWGNQRPGASPPARYGYLGGKQRSSDAAGGLILMGARLYNPTTGRFLSVDPVPGGSANDYDYVNQDPINYRDFLGQSPHGSLEPRDARQYFKQMRKAEDRARGNLLKRQVHLWFMCNWDFAMFDWFSNNDPMSSGMERYLAQYRNNVRLYSENAFRIGGKIWKAIAKAGIPGPWKLFTGRS